MVTGLIGLIAVLVALAAVLAGIGHVGYLAMLTSAAQKRPGGEPAVEFAKGRFPVAGITLGAALLALLVTTGGVAFDVIAILIAGGGGIASVKSLQSTQSRFRRGLY